MGQYYRGIVLDKKTKNKVEECFSCYDYNNGAKLMEHSYVGNYYVKIYEHTLANEFKGYPFVWGGDYADERHRKNTVNDYVLGREFIEEKRDNYARENGFEKVINGKYGQDYQKDGVFFDSIDILPKIPYEELPTYKYVINLTKKMFVKIPTFNENENEWIIHPLPLLCADGNGRGGGDYRGTNMELIGSWAFDRIAVANKLPKNIKKELVVKFVEWEDENINDYTYIDN